MCRLRHLRNIASMRRVTAKPPNMLMLVSAMPTTASQRISSSGRPVRRASGTAARSGSARR